MLVFLLVILAYAGGKREAKEKTVIVSSCEDLYYNYDYEVDEGRVWNSIHYNHTSFYLWKRGDYFDLSYSDYNIEENKYGIGVWFNTYHNETTVRLTDLNCLGDNWNTDNMSYINDSWKCTHKYNLKVYSEEWT